MASNGILNKSIIFYSRFPHDNMSRECLMELEKTPALNKQFVKICVHHPQDTSRPPEVNLPQIVKKLVGSGKIPILAVSGMKYPIFAQYAISWLQDNALKQQNGGLSSISIGGNDTDDCSTVEQTELMSSLFINPEYNLGFTDAKGETGKDYANIDEACQLQIQTYNDVSEKGAAATEAQKKLEQIKNARNNDIPPPIRRIGGMPTEGMPMMPMMPNMGGNGMQMPRGMPMQGGMQMPMQMPMQGGMQMQMPMQGGMQMQMPMQGGMQMPMMGGMQMPMMGGGGGGGAPMPSFLTPVKTRPDRN